VPRVKAINANPFAFDEKRDGNDGGDENTLYVFGR
jgi:hypothetical protein